MPALVMTTSAAMLLTWRSRWTLLAPLLLLLLCSYSESLSSRNKSQVIRLRHHRKHQKTLQGLPYNVSSSPYLTLSRGKASIDGGDNKLFNQWSPWSPCSRHCNQRRKRRCVDKLRCGKLVLREERSCHGHKCRRRKRQAFHVVPSSIQRHVHKRPAKNNFQPKLSSDVRYLLDWESELDRFGDFRMDSLFFSSWTKWAPCTRSCNTRRFRTCRFQLVCGQSVIREEAFCYVEGTFCEKLFRTRWGFADSDLAEEAHTPKYVETDMYNSTARMSPGQLPSYECGLSNSSVISSFLRIIGGKEAVRGKWPWQVAILNRFKEAFCGGTLIAPRWVLTAAHCVRKRLYVRVGEHDLAALEGTEIDFRVQEAFLHPLYDPDTVDNDVALLRLPENLSPGRFQGLACLPRPNQQLPDHVCTIIGWGKERNTHLFGTEVLHEARVPIVKNSVCKEVYEDYHITDNMFCAGYKRGRVDSCAGDSGGPLLCQIQGRWTIFGITSFGEGCGKKGKFGIYSRVPNYVRWIEKVIKVNGR